MEELAAIMEQFGATALWAIVLYKGLNLLQGAIMFLLIGYGIKKAWPAIISLAETIDKD